MKLKLLLLLLFSFLLINDMPGQKKNKKFTVSGYVMDTGKNPVAGAIILLDKNNTGRVTDAEGFYKIKVRPDAGIITILTMYGASAEASIDGRTLINFVLEEASALHREVQNKKEVDEVVDIGYGVIKKNDLTLPVNKIDVAGTNYSSYSNIYDLLHGSVPGVQVIGKSIIIRGTSTIYSNSDPLFVVDGNITESIDYIHPGMVKSIQILKGASASIYGSRGANGVILINTIKAGDR